MSNIDLSQMMTAKAKTEARQVAEIEASQAQAQAYLVKTDWYVTRKVETGKEIPDDILAARKAAREAGRYLL
jgi:hypothetical protein